MPETPDLLAGLKCGLRDRVSTMVDKVLNSVFACILLTDLCQFGASAGFHTLRGMQMPVSVPHQDSSLHQKSIIGSTFGHPFREMNRSAGRTCGSCFGSCQQNPGSLVGARPGELELRSASNATSPLDTFSFSPFLVTWVPHPSPQPAKRCESLGRGNA